MTFHTKVQSRFEDLIEAGEKIKATKQTVGGSSGRVVSIPSTYVNEEQARQWTMSVLTVLKSALGEDSDNYQQVKDNLEMCMSTAISASFSRV